jgi:type I restriction enzyme S subunit
MELVKLGKVADFINGKAFKPSDWEDKGKKIIRIQNLNDCSKPYNRTLQNVEDKYLVYPNDILVSWSASLGVFEWKDSEIAVLNQHIFKVVPDEKLICKPYLKYALDKSIDLMLKYTHGSTMKHINRQEFLNIEIPLPPIASQRTIANILDKADEIIRKRKEAIALTEQLQKSIFLDMFGDPVTNPKGWEKVTVNDVVSEVKDGPHVSPEYSHNGIPILSTRNIRPNELIMEDIKYISEDVYLNLIKRFKPQKGDVLLTKGGTTGFAKVVDWDWNFAVWVHLALLRPNNKIRSEFLEATLNSPNCYLQSQLYTHGIANKDLGLNRIRKIKMCLPPLDLQDEYCQIRKKTLFLLNKNKKSLKESENLFNSLLQKAFKGEL